MSDMDKKSTDLTSGGVAELAVQNLSIGVVHMDQRSPAKLRPLKNTKNLTPEEKKAKKHENKIATSLSVLDETPGTSKAECVTTMLGAQETDCQLLAATRVDVPDELAHLPEKSSRDEFQVHHGVINSDRLDMSRFSQRLIKTVDGTDVGVHLLQSDGFACPLLVLDKSGLGLRMPSDSFSLADIKKCVGSRRIIQALDVQTGLGENMSMKAYLRYYEQPQRARTLSINNLILSQTKLATHVESPEAVRRTDWANLAYSAAGYNHFAEGITPAYMRLQRLCDIAVVGSFTDFHIDAGGASRWYHVFRGVKMIWMVPPTADNYNLYLGWLTDTVHWDRGPEAREHEGETALGHLQRESIVRRHLFYADRVQNCQAVVLRAGSTLFIPAGWIYALYSMEDSISFSGSFLHSFNVSTQLRVFQLENQLKTPLMLRYPLYTDLHWYVLEAYVRCLTGARHLVVLIKQEPDEERIKDGFNSELLKQDINQEMKHEGENLTTGDEKSSIMFEDKNLKDEEKPKLKTDGNEGVELKGQDEAVKVDSCLVNNVPLVVDVTRASETASLGGMSLSSSSSYTHQDPATNSQVVGGSKSGDLDMGQDHSSGVWIHISSFEREGIDSMIDFLESLGLDSAPRDIEDACGLIKQAKLMLVAHSADDAKLSITGRPILSTIDKKKEKIKLKQHCQASQPPALSPFLSNHSHTPTPSPSQSITGSMGRKFDANARRRRVRCKKCERCTSSECGDCAYCQDMKKFGGMGRLKQTCIGRQCIAPILPTAAVCYFCKKGEAESGPSGDSPTDLLMECGICWKISHPACLKLSYPELATEGVINDDLPSSWECPLCCVQGKRGQLKPRVVKGQGISRLREEGMDEEDDGQSSSIESNPADDDVLHSQAKNKNKTLQENKSLLNTCNADQMTKICDESPSGIQNHVPETQWPEDSSHQLDQLGLSPPNSKKSPDSVGGVASAAASLSPNRYSSGMYVVRPLPCAPPPKHVATTAGQSHAMDREHWLRVFSWLTPKDLSVCMGVCKVWNRWAFDHRLWKRINLERKQIRQTHLIGIVRRQPKCLDLSMTNISNRQLSWLLARLPHLKELNLSSNSWAAVSALCSSAVCPPGLVKLNLSWVTGLCDPSLIELVSPPAAYGAAVRPGVQDSSVSRLRNCSTLRLTGTDITDGALAVYVRHMPRLEVVDLRLCVGVTDCGVRTLCTGMGDRLIELILTGCVHVTGVGLESVSRLCPNIKKLSMDSCTHIGDEQKAEFLRRHVNCVAIF